MRQALFFDLDGTLTDPMLGITRCIQFALESLDMEAPDADTLTWCIGPPLLDSFRRLVGTERAPAALARYRERFASVGLYENQLYPDIDDLLRRLCESGSILHVASSKPQVYVERILEHFEISHHFDRVFGSELDGRRTDKAVLLKHALDVSRVRPEDAMMIGDRSHDVMGARANGIGCIGVLYGYGTRVELEQAGVDRLAGSPAELLTMLYSDAEKFRNPT